MDDNEDIDDFDPYQYSAQNMQYQWSGYWDVFCQQSLYDIRDMIRAGDPVDQITTRMVAIDDHIIEHLDGVIASESLGVVSQTCLQLRRMISSYEQGNYVDEDIDNLVQMYRGPLRELPLEDSPEEPAEEQRVQLYFLTPLDSVDPQEQQTHADQEIVEEEDEFIRELVGEEEGFGLNNLFQP